MLKHTYRKRRIKEKNQVKNRLCIDFEDAEYDLLSVFLEEEFIQFWPQIDDVLDRVLDREVSEDTFKGNRVQMAVFYNYAILYDHTAEDGIGEWCQVGMDDLIDLMNEYSAEYERFASE